MAHHTPGRPQQGPTPNQPPSNWWGKAWRSARLVLFVLLTVMGTLILGALLMSNPTGVLSLSEAMQRYFWLIAGVRWATYGLLIVFWPSVAGALTRLATRSGNTREKKDHILRTVQRWRWPLARILAVYEVMFPLNMAGWLGGLQ